MRTLFLKAVSSITLWSSHSSIYDRPSHDGAIKERGYEAAILRRITYQNDGASKSQLLIMNETLFLKSSCGALEEKQHLSRTRLIPG